MKFTPHPILTPPSDEDILRLTSNADGSVNEDGLRELQRMWQQHERAIELSEQDPYRYEWALPARGRIKKALAESREVLCLGGNRASKTRSAARIVVEAALQGKNGTMMLFSQDAKTSVQVQQRSIFDMLPKEYKKGVKSKQGYLSYSAQNGFTGDGFIMPDTNTQILFRTYASFANNSTNLEGYDLGFKHTDGINLAVWMDEYLHEFDLVKTIRLRGATREGKLLVTVTPINNYNPYISEHLNGAQALESRYVEFLRKEMPIYLKSARDDSSVVCLHTDENPFGNPASVASSLQYESEEQKQIRYCGWPSNLQASLFPHFSVNANVINELPTNLKDKKYWTGYQVVDPAGARNYATIWAFAGLNGDIVIAKEWPDVRSYGEWAVRRAGEAYGFGAGASKIGLDVKGYADLYREIEDEMGAEIFSRIGDSRFFAQESSDNIDLFDQFAEHGLYFVPSDGRREHVGITALDEWFRYNVDKPIDASNKPRIKIHKDCVNLIHAVINYKMGDKKFEPLKDWIDLLRYLRLCDAGNGPTHYEPSAFNSKKQTWGY